MSAVGTPVESKRVRQPRGVVLSVLNTDGGGFAVPVLEVEAELSEPRGEEDRRVDDNDKLSSDGTLASFGDMRVTTFIPSPTLLLAGMNNVVRPSLRLREVLSG